MFFLPFSYYCQISYNLKNQLDSVSKLDQLYRKELDKLFLNEQIQDSILLSINMSFVDYTKEIMTKQELIDISNLKFIDSIIEVYGYPGKKLVGVPSNEVAWSIIQHSNSIEYYLKVIKVAANNQELPFELYAKMYDRFLKQKGKKQLYGTQLECFPNTEAKIDCKIYPVKRKNGVNRRRKKAGFKLTMEENAKQLGVVLE